MIIMQKIKNINKLDLFTFFNLLILLICIILLSIGSINKLISGVIISFTSVCIIFILVIKYKKAKLQKSNSLSQNSESKDTINKYMANYIKKSDDNHIYELEDIQLAESNKSDDDTYKNSYMSDYNKKRKEKAMMERTMWENEIKTLNVRKNKPVNDNKTFYDISSITSKEKEAFDKQIAVLEKRIKERDDIISSN